MATKFIVIGEGEVKEKGKRPIVLLNIVTLNGKNPLAIGKPNQWQVIEFICRNYTPNTDLIFAYNNKREYGVSFFGHWNDGIV